MNSKKETSLVKFIENIWYHYKYVILISLAVLVMLFVGISQMVAKKAPDVFIYHVSSYGITAKSIDELTETLASFADDYNDDGAVTVDYKEEIYVPDVKATVNGELSVTDSFNLELFAGDCVIYIMDESFYKGNRDYMVKLEDILGYVPSGAYDDKALLLSELPAYETTPGLCGLPADSFICVRQRRVGFKEADKDVYDNNVDYFKRLVEFLNTPKEVG